MFKEICIMSDVDVGEVSPKFQVFFLTFWASLKPSDDQALFFFKQMGDF